MASVTERVSTSLGVLPPGHKLGRYEILTKLASGGMAVVYVANAQGAAGFERLVAAKVLHGNLAHEDEFIRMFLDEARLAARIRHQNVVPTIDISDTPAVGYFLVMEYIEGDHLGALLSNAHKAGERLPLPVVLRIVLDSLAGLGAAHDLRDEDGKSVNLVHRDVSPHNIMVGVDGVARLTDFGVAKAEDRLTHTRDGQVKGKIAYMAPEQAALGTCDARSDLFAMGIIVWECLTGRRLFRAEGTVATLHKLLHEEIAPVSAVDPSLAPFDALLRRALSREPASRFQSADEMLEAFEAVAPRVGGIASRRAVSKAVEQYAAEKLQRDRALVDAAKAALRSGAALPGSTPESSAAGAHSEASSPSRSVSRARPSLDDGTVPRLFTNARSQRNTLSGMVAPPISLPAVPPPVGATFAVPEAPPQRVVPEPHAAPKSRRTTLGLAATGAALLIAALAVFWAINRAPAAAPPTVPSQIAAPMAVRPNSPQARPPEVPSSGPAQAVQPASGAVEPTAMAAAAPEPAAASPEAPAPAAASPVVPEPAVARPDAPADATAAPPRPGAAPPRRPLAKAPATAPTASSPTASPTSSPARRPLPGSAQPGPRRPVPQRPRDGLIPNPYMR